MSATLDELPGGDRHAVVGQRAGPRQRGDLHRQQRIGRAVVRIAEAEVGRREGVGRVLQRASPSCRRPPARRSPA